MTTPTTLRFFNTAARQKVDFIPIKEGAVKLYTCGPTVYNFAHIGNFRTYMFEDLLRRTLKHFGYNVTHVMNLTDVDDKTIRGAIQKGITLDEFTQPYITAFFEDLDALLIERAEHYPAATDFIPSMIDIVSTLLKKGIAYQGGDGSVYFAISKFPKYGCLSHLHLDELQAGASERVASDEYEKDNVADFVLWKAYEPERDGDIYWESPFGKGRPGWHIECSAMAMQILGETIDIHVGGIDNMFPHHENEIAQSEACTGKRFANYWLHAEHLVVDSKKMSKSLGNFFTLRDLLSKGYSGRQIRYLLIQTHYKTQLNFTFPGLDAAKSAIHRLDDFILRLQEGQFAAQSSGKASAYLHSTQKAFDEALADDLNISQALAAIFELVRHINALCDSQDLSRPEADATLQVMEKFNRVIGVLNFETKEEEIPSEVQEAFDKRQQARKEKQWKLADEMRDFISEKGYIIEDSPQGSRLKKS